MNKNIETVNRAGTVYLDKNGKPVSEAEYKKLAEAPAAAKPVRRQSLLKKVKPRRKPRLARGIKSCPF